MLQRGSDSSTDAIAERIRAIVLRQPGHNLQVRSRMLGLPPEALEPLVEDPKRVLRSAVLVDLIAALVREAGVDPKWLLTGDCDPTTHRRALLLGEDRTPHGIRAMRAFVQLEYRRARRGRMLRALPRSLLPERILKLATGARSAK